MVVIEFYEEVWIPVKGYEGLYECSTEGRIRSLPKLIPASKVRGPFMTKGQILACTCLSPDGYKLCTLYDEKHKPLTKTVHSFIFYSFNPEDRPMRGFEVDHDDNDKLNNRPTNLKLISSRQNSTKRSLQKPKTSIYTGVCWDPTKTKWVAMIKINGKSKYLGRYENEADAAHAYQQALAKL